MAKTKQELQKEIDQLQEYIDAVDSAREFSLELGDSVYEKYNAAVERQKDLAKQLHIIAAFIKIVLPVRLQQVHRCSTTDPQMYRRK